MKKFIGQLKTVENLKETIYNFSLEDEKAARLLHAADLYRPAMSHWHMAAEKKIQSKIVSACAARSNEEIRQRLHFPHDLAEAVGTLLSVLPGPSELKSEIQRQINAKAFGEFDMRFLANNLRYPAYLKKHDIFRELHVERSDSATLRNCVERLEGFIKEFEILQAWH